MKRRFVTLGLLLSLVCFVSLLPRTAHGQAVYGSIFGTVTDASGAAVPNAKVTVTDINKGTKDETTTNATGNYNVTHLSPDAYSVRVEAAGFRSASPPTPRFAWTCHCKLVRSASRSRSPAKRRN